MEFSGTHREIRNFTVPAFISKAIFVGLNPMTVLGLTTQKTLLTACLYFKLQS